MSIWRDQWTPPYQATDRGVRELEVGMVVGFDFRAWEVTHVREHEATDDSRRDRKGTFRRLHGPRHDRENKVGDVAFTWSSRAYSLHVYRDGIVWLCSCCGHPAPCRMQVAKELSEQSAKVMDERMNRMGLGLCYGCGEVITTRQERVTFPGDHADFPGRPGPTFHSRQKCHGERRAYAKRAGLDINGQPLSSDAPASLREDS